MNDALGTVRLVLLSELGTISTHDDDTVEIVSMALKATSLISVKC